MNSLCIFCPTYLDTCKVSYMFISSMSIVLEQKEQKLKEFVTKIKRSLEFAKPGRGELSSQ